MPSSWLVWLTHPHGSVLRLVLRHIPPPKQGHHTYQPHHQEIRDKPGMSRQTAWAAGRIDAGQSTSGRLFTRYTYHSGRNPHRGNSVYNTRTACTDRQTTRRMRKSQMASCTYMYTVRAPSYRAASTSPTSLNVTKQTGTR